MKLPATDYELVESLHKDVVKFPDEKGNDEVTIPQSEKLVFHNGSVYKRLSMRSGIIHLKMYLSFSYDLSHPE